MPSKNHNGQSSGYQFGAFKGVFTPSILTILGVIMYLRFGWVLGNVGLPLTLVIVTLSTAITFLTALALSSLATNMKVGGGGAYYIISRSLGIEAGAAVGVPLFFAQALGISFYIAGFAESLAAVFPSVPSTLIGVLTLLALAVLAYLSADLALKMQFFIMAAIVASLISFFLGAAPEPVAGGQVGPFAPQPFWIVFAVFFPAVTGIEAGIAMSGDLKNPARALPLGTIGAIILGYCIYLAIPIFLDSLVDNRQLLISNSLIMKDVARWGNLILIGLWGASLSSALGALLGAPRTLQALALDGVIPRFIGKSFGEQKDPRIATAIAFGIAFLGILLGDLNVIAPVLSMFFLTSYGLLNISAGFEDLIASPSWRPKFRVSWKLNFLGAFACFGTMFMINPGATFIAAAVSFTIYTIMERRRLVARWGDVRYGILMLLTKYGIEQLAFRQPDTRTWKPNILVMSGSPKNRWYLIALANAISHGRNLMTVATVLCGTDIPAERVEKTTGTIKEYLKKREVTALVKVVRADDALGGLQSLVRAYGFGPITPNTILLGDSEQAENFLEYVRLVDQICRMRRNLVMVRGGEEEPNLDAGHRIDVWWARKSPNASLMLALAYQLKRSQGWQDSELVLKTVVSEDSDTEDLELETARNQLLEFIARERLDARAEVVQVASENVFDDIRESSQGASIVFIGMREREENESLESYEKYYKQLLSNTAGFPPTAMVFAAENLAFSRIFSS